MNYIIARLGLVTRFLSCIALLIILSALCTPLYAQFTSGSITGIVFDPNGAQVANATVTATSITTNAARTVSTNTSGIFAIPGLQPGDYKLTATAKGFQLSSIDITLTLQQVLNYNFNLKIGASNQTVTVKESASALALETQSHEVSDLVTGRTIENLPANDGEVFSTLASATNVQSYNSATQFGDIGGYNEGANSLTIGGTAYGTSSYLQDGVENFNMFTKTANLQPSLEAVQEVSLVQNGASARFDEPSVVNVITKSGTNEFHGRLYDYVRNNALDAIGYYKTPKPPLTYNQYGANIGGPILRNKLFFFFDYAGLRESSSSPLFAKVPTQQERNGNFSQDNTIYDPATYNAQTGAISPFPGNIIPTNRISTFAKQFSQYYPMPTGSSIPGLNFQTVKASTVSYDSYLGRLDYNLSDADTVYGAYETTNPNTVSPTFAVTPIFNTEMPQGATNAYVQETHTFSQRLLNIARFGYNGSTVLSTIAGAGTQDYVKEFGIANLNPTQAQWAPPSAVFSAHSALGNPYAPQGATQKLYEVADEIDWQLGKHSLMIGGEVDKLYFDGDWVIFQNGYLGFNGQYTTNHASQPSGGNDLADFSLGLPFLALGSKGETVGHFRQWNVIPYVQDDWKVSKRLTLNLGFRYDYYQSPKDALGLSHIYVPQTNTTLKGTFKQDWHDFAPRVGFAYSINGNTVVHGGYGIYYAPFMYAELLFLQASPPNWALQANVYSADNPVPIADTFAANPSVVSPWTTSLEMPEPRVQQYNLSVQRSIGSNWVASISYLGSLFAHSNLRYNPNQARVPSNPTNPSPIQSRRPYPWVQDVYMAADVGFGNYNGLEGELERKYTNGLSLLTSFVWSKAMDIASADNANPENGLDIAASYGPSDYNQPVVFKFSPVYQVPIGTGWLKRQVIGGWQVSGILSVQSGTPFTVGANDYSDTGSFHDQYANQVCNPNSIAHRTIVHWFNTSCLVQPGAGQLGNEKRNNILGPRTTDLDASLFKNFSIIRKSELQFRSDFFDAFNHPLLFIPVESQSTSSPTYGEANVGGARVIQLSLKLIY